MTPLTDLSSGHYLGFPGGLYPEGKNSPPADYAKAGAVLAAAVQPLSRDGQPSPSGNVVMISIGMSNASREFSEFIQLANEDSRKNPRLQLIDAALEGASASKIAAPRGDYWKHVDLQLQRAEITPAQVQVVWLKPGEGYERPGFPEKAQRLQRSLRGIFEILRTKFPQLKLVYVSSRIYGGYSQIDVSPEPLAYEGGFAVKWFIEERINQGNFDEVSPWVAWGPYLWADGLTPRGDGLIWEREDLEPDGVHPSARGALKVAQQLLEFFAAEPTAQPWFFAATN